MPRIVELPNAQYLSELYLSGLSVNEIAKQFSCSHTAINTCLKRVNTQMRGRGEFLALAGVKRRKPIPIEAIADYQGGMSEKATAQKYAVTRASLRVFLLDSGIAIRGRSDAEKVKWSALKTDRAAVERQCSAAWQAAKKPRVLISMDDTIIKGASLGYGCYRMARAYGVAKGAMLKRMRVLKVVSTTPQQARQRSAHGIQQRAFIDAAIGKRTAKMISPIEYPFVDELKRRGLKPVHQRALASYNLDIAFDESRIAVEVERRSLRESKSLKRERIEYLISAGWKLLVVYIPKGSDSINIAAICDQIETLLHLVSANHALTGQYGMISRHGKPIAIRGDNFNGYTRIEGF